MSRLGPEMEDNLLARLIRLALVLACGAALLATAPTASAAPVHDYAIIARDIIPAGEYQLIPTSATLPKIEQQAQMYNALTPLFNHVTAGAIKADFKPEPIAVRDAPGPE